jgi:hypothetical protein
MIDEDNAERLAQFARRLELAMDMNRVELPDKFKGRNVEVAKRIENEFGIRVTAETISKFLGTALAQLFGAKIVETPATGPVHFKAAVRGAVLSVHSVLADREGDGWTVAVPKFAADTFILAVLPLSSTSFRLVELDWDEVEAVGEDHGDAYGVRIDSKLRTGGAAWTEIHDFGRIPR